MYDAVIIGAGVVGGMVARSLSAYELKICILERENDVAMGATRANSAIVHAGFDAKEGSLKAKFNVEGSKMMEQVAKELGVKYKRNGSLVIGFNDEDLEEIKRLYERGIKNGVEDLEIIDGNRLRELESEISENAVAALYAPTGAIICPYELTVAAIGNAMDNGAELKCGFEVTNIRKTDDGFEIFSGEESVKAKYVINAAGVYSDKIAKMVGDDSFEINPVKGEYILLDKEAGGILKSTVFRTPTKLGKGILVSPTVDGNLILGPTAVPGEDKEDKKTTAQGFAGILKEAGENVKNLPRNKAITSFCGIRAKGNTGDFVIGSPVAGFINVAAIESPGLTSAPAIGEYVKNMISGLTPKKDYNPIRKPAHYFKNASDEEKNKIIKENPAYGRIICRCEEVTEGEILEAIRTNPKPTDMDGVKRRTRAQMGRCQGGFCTPYIMKLLSSELGIPMERVTKSGGDSYLTEGVTK